MLFVLISIYLIFNDQENGVIRVTSNCMQEDQKSGIKIYTFYIYYNRWDYIHPRLS